MALTDAQIKAAKPQAKPYRKADMNSLYLEVLPNGSKLWRLKSGSMARRTGSRSVAIPR